MPGLLFHTAHGKNFKFIKTNQFIILFITKFDKIQIEKIWNEIKNDLQHMEASEHK